MQTFLPYKSFVESLRCLDDKRLGKQRVEALQILNALEPGSESRWRHHPAVKMWEGWAYELRFYHDIAILLWVGRGHVNRMQQRWFGMNNWSVVQLWNTANLEFLDSFVDKPNWLTNSFCAAHRSNLLRKDPVWYGQFGWTEPNNLPYIWPVK